MRNPPPRGGMLLRNLASEGGKLVRNSPREGGKLVRNRPREGGKLVGNQPREGGKLVGANIGRGVISSEGVSSTQTRNRRRIRYVPYGKTTVRLPERHSSDASRCRRQNRR